MGPGRIFVREGNPTMWLFRVEHNACCFSLFVIYCNCLIPACLYSSTLSHLSFLSIATMTVACIDVYNVSMIYT